MSNFICPMCQFEAPTMALNLSHLRLVHGSDPRFCVQCGVGGCPYTGKSFSALYSHIYRSHPDCGVIQKRVIHRNLENEPPASNDNPERPSDVLELLGWLIVSYSLLVDLNIRCCG